MKILKKVDARELRPKLRGNIPHNVLLREAYRVKNLKRLLMIVNFNILYSKSVDLKEKNNIVK